MSIIQRFARLNRDIRVTVPLYNCSSITCLFVVLILIVYIYLLVPLSIPVIVAMYVCIAPVTHLTVAGCIFE